VNDRVTEQIQNPYFFWILSGTLTPKRSWIDSSTTPRHSQQSQQQIVTV
jgi:hypothetical protein